MNHYNNDGGWKLAYSAFTLVTLIFLALLIFLEVRANFTWKRDYHQLWSLADKSSTIPAKQQYINKFVETLKAGKERGRFADNDAIFLKTPDNAFDSNLKAVETLAQRLTEIQGMNPNSFEYNTAIQQITAQEQGEAHKLIDVLKGCYVLENYPLVWGWIGAIGWMSFVLLVIAEFIAASIIWEWDL